MADDINLVAANKSLRASALNEGQRESLHRRRTSKQYPARSAALLPRQLAKAEGNHFSCPAKASWERWIRPFRYSDKGSFYASPALNGAIQPLCRFVRK